jgi:hypothetical protein
MMSCNHMLVRTPDGLIAALLTSHCMCCAAAALSSIDTKLSTTL